MHAFGSKQEAGFPVLDPDVIAEAAWKLTAEREEREVVFDALST